MYPHTKYNGSIWKDKKKLWSRHAAEKKQKKRKKQKKKSD
jgi:hypothetical protein